MIRLWWRLVQTSFHLLYNQLAFTYDWVSWIVSLGAWRCWCRATLRHLQAEPGEPILELAHGTGNLQLDLRVAGHFSIGLDLSPAMGRIASAKLAKNGHTLRLVRARAQHLPFTSGKFVAVISTFPTDFILAAETLAEVHRVLKPGGQFLVVPNAILTGSGALARFIEWLYRITGQRGGEDWDVRGFFAAHGFEAETITEACPRSQVLVICARKKA